MIAARRTSFSPAGPAWATWILSSPSSALRSVVDLGRGLAPQVTGGAQLGLAVVEPQVDGLRRPSGDDEPDEAGEAQLGREEAACLAVADAVHERRAGVDGDPALARDRRPGQEAVHHGQDVGRIETVRPRLHPLEDVVQPHRGAAEVGPEERLGRVLVLERPGREVDVQDASGDDAWHSAASASQRWPVAKRPTPADPASVRRARVARHARGRAVPRPAPGCRPRRYPAAATAVTAGLPGVPRQPIGQRGAQQPRELVPLDQEAVVALGGLDLDVGRVDARGRRLAHEEPDLVRAVEDVALDADAGQPGAGGRERAEGLHDPAAVPAHVVAVHDPDQDAVRVRVEAVEDLAALVVEVGHDREPAVLLDVAPEAAVEVGRRSDRSSSPAGGRATGPRGRAAR